MINKIFNEDCFVTMDRIIEKNIKVNNIITSPFYNTSRSSKCHNTQKSRDNHEGRYDVHLDNMTDKEYIEFTLKLFDRFEKGNLFICYACWCVAYCAACLRPEV